MRELQKQQTNELSTDINVITAEINSYKQVAGQAIFEIGKRLKHVKENDLVYGEWEKWCKSELNFSSRQARKYIRVFERFSDRNLGSEVGIKKLDLLSVYDDEELEKPREMPDGTEKALLEMSQKEIEDFKQRERKAVEDKNKAIRAAEEAERRANEAEKRAEELENREPEVIEKEVPVERTVFKEVMPESEKRRLQELEQFKNTHGHRIKEIEGEKDEIEASLMKSYTRIRELERLERSVKSERENPLYDIYRSTSGAVGHLKAFTDNEKFAYDVLGNSDAQLIRKLESELRNIKRFTDTLLSLISYNSGTVVVDAETNGNTYLEVIE